MKAEISENDVTMEWLMEDAIVSDAGLSPAKMTVRVGALSEAHSHPNCSEAIHVMQGTIEQRCGKEWSVKTAGDTCLIPAGAIHQTRNVGREPAILMVAHSSGSRVYQK
ncbi:MAG: cupin domain-containing protein [Alphaproteobacteria bacterium]